LSSITASEPSVLVTHDNDGIAVLTINRPRSYNALSIQTMESMIYEINQLHNNKAIKVVIIRGAGKGFCSGHDLKELKQNQSKEFYAKTFNLCSRLMLSIINLPQPTIAQVHGIATAAGCQLVATCDLAIAEENAKFATPGANIGLFCSTPMVALSRNLTRKQSMEMLLLGDFISSAQALKMGLINRVFPQEKLEEETRKVALQISKKIFLCFKKLEKKLFINKLNWILNLLTFIAMI